MVAGVLSGVPVAGAAGADSVEDNLGQAAALPDAVFVWRDTPEVPQSSSTPAGSRSRSWAMARLNISSSSSFTGGGRPVGQSTRPSASGIRGARPVRRPSLIYRWAGVRGGRWTRGRGCRLVRARTRRQDWRRLSERKLPRDRHGHAMPRRDRAHRRCPQHLHRPPAHRRHPRRPPPRRPWRAIRTSAWPRSCTCWTRSLPRKASRPSRVLGRRASRHYRRE